MLNVDFWQSRYQSGQTPWDLGQASPQWRQLEAAPVKSLLPPGKMAALGCGRGHDAAYFAQQGFEVIGLDYADDALVQAKQLYGKQVQFEKVDILKPEQIPPKLSHHFDYVLEHTCFCAIHPADRARYVQTVQALLKQDGMLIGIFWEHGNADGPPFSTTEADLNRYFEPQFDCLKRFDLPAVSGRDGVERLLILRQKGEL